MLKKPLTIFTCLTLIVISISSCGGNQKSTDNQDTIKSQAETSKPKSAGELLIAKSDCMGCHHVSNKLVGPSYSEIANKYTPTPENIAKLAYNIINGVEADKGDWGKLPMPAHSQLSKHDAEEIVKYILSTKQ